MQISDGRGTNSTKKAALNKNKVEQYFKDNPGRTKADCARELDIHYATVLRHTEKL